jgi:hypothetical protein
LSIIPKQTHLTSGTTVLGTITRTQKVTLAIRKVLRGGSGVELVSTPALAAVFDACVQVVGAGCEAHGDGHGGAVVEDLRGEETAAGGFGGAGVVGEVYVALGDDGAGRFGGCGAGRGGAGGG